MSKKLPALHFYPGDWFKDPGILALNCEEKGAWFQMLLLMFQSSRRGYLTLNGQPYPPQSLAKVLGISEKKMKKISEKLISFGVAQVEIETGIFFNKRMILDEERRQILENNGKQGGRPKKEKETKTKTKKKPKPKQDPENENESENEIKVLNKNEKEIEFEKTWSEYPEKKGKDEAWIKFCNQVETLEDVENFRRALVNYKKDMVRVRKTVPDRQWLHGSTFFFRRWKDFLDYKPPGNRSKPHTPVKVDTPKAEDCVPAGDLKNLVKDFNKSLKGVSE